eukprot:scaffold66793_cov90-Phaeocystis_antarctica.AAC.1
MPLTSSLCGSIHLSTHERSPSWLDTPSYLIHGPANNGHGLDSQTVAAPIEVCTQRRTCRCSEPAQ